MAVSADDKAEAIRSVFAAIAANADPLVAGEQIGRHAVAGVAELAERNDPDLEAETIIAAASNVAAVIEGLAEGRPAASLGVPAPTLEWASTLVHRGVGVATIPRCYLVGQALFEDWYRKQLEVSDLPAELKWELTGTVSQYLLAFVENACGALVEHYERERDRWVRGADSIRTELVLSIVEGSRFDAAAAGATLRYDLARQHVAFLTWADPNLDEPPPTSALKEAAAELARTLGGMELLVIPAGQSVVWAWTAGDRVSDGLGARLKLEKGLFGAVGAVGSGPPGFVQSHHEARHARRMSDLLSRPTGSVVRYRSVVLTSLLTSDPRAAARFVETELGVLGTDTDSNRRMRATLAVWFEEGMSWGRTARRLGVHQNTVIYRARRAEELLGRPLTERRLELEAALRLADLRDALQTIEQTQAV